MSSYENEQKEQEAKGELTKVKSSQRVGFISLLCVTTSLQCNSLRILLHPHQLFKQPPHCIQLAETCQEENKVSVTFCPFSSDSGGPSIGHCDAARCIPIIHYYHNTMREYSLQPQQGSRNVYMDTQQHTNMVVQLFYLEYMHFVTRKQDVSKEMWSTKVRVKESRAAAYQGLLLCQLLSLYCSFTVHFHLTKGTESETEHCHGPSWFLTAFFLKPCDQHLWYTATSTVLLTV